MHVEEHPGRQPATVWLHHGVGSTRAWDSFLPGTADGRRVVVYDRQGFGGSAQDRRFTIRMFEEDVEDLRTLLADRGLEKVHLVGHSDGGTVALLLAARAPELVLSVAVIAVHVRGDDVTVATLRRMGPPSQWPAPMQRSLRRAHGTEWADVAGRWHALWTSPEWESWSIVDELSTIACPMLVTHGLHDELSPPLHAETILEAIPRARIAWVDTRTHDPHRVTPEQFVADLHALWREAEGIMRG
jgi:pimeloyl-ACP methyl ester carboxylesterase